MLPSRARGFAVGALLHAAVLLLFGAGAVAQETVRVISYNTTILGTAIQGRGNAPQDLRQETELVETGVNLLQESTDRSAYNLACSSGRCSVVIDEERCAGGPVDA